MSQIFQGLSNASEPQLVVVISFVVGAIAMSVAVVVKIFEIIKDYYNKFRNSIRAQNSAGESM